MLTAVHRGHTLQHLEEKYGECLAKIREASAPLSARLKTLRDDREELDCRLRALALWEQERIEEIAFAAVQMKKELDLQMAEKMSGINRSGVAIEKEISGLQTFIGDLDSDLKKCKKTELVAKGREMGKRLEELRAHPDVAPAPTRFAPFRSASPCLPVMLGRRSSQNSLAEDSSYRRRRRVPASSQIRSCLMEFRGH